MCYASLHVSFCLKDMHLFILFSIFSLCSSANTTPENIGLKQANTQQKKTWTIYHHERGKRRESNTTEGTYCVEYSSYSIRRTVGTATYTVLLLWAHWLTLYLVEFGFSSFLRFRAHRLRELTFYHNVGTQQVFSIVNIALYYFIE